MGTAVDFLKMLEAITVNIWHMFGHINMFKYSVTFSEKSYTSNII